MRGRPRVQATVALLVSAGFLVVAGAAAAPNAVGSSCTPAQKSQRLAALAGFEKSMATQRKAYFAKHRSAALRRAYVRGQQAHLKRLEADAACTVVAPATDAARLAQLRTYAGQMEALILFDPATLGPADDALATITSDLEACETNPEDSNCPVPDSEYQATAKTVRDAADELKKLKDKLALVVPPAMSVSQYDAAARSAAADCGIDLATIASAHKAFLSKASKWESLLRQWAAVYAGGKSVDWDTTDYLPGTGGLWDEPRDATMEWAVMVDLYWSSLARSHTVSSAQPVPDWIGQLNDGECPPPG